MEITEIIKGDMAEYGYKRGREDEREEWASSLQPEMLEITVRARSKEDRIDNIRVFVTFNEIEQSNVEIVPFLLRKTLQEIARKGEVIKALSQAKLPP